VSFQVFFRILSRTPADAMDFFLFLLDDVWTQFSNPPRVHPLVGQDSDEEPFSFRYGSGRKW